MPVGFELNELVIAGEIVLCNGQWWKTLRSIRSEIAVGAFLELRFEPLILVRDSRLQQLLGFGWRQCTRFRPLTRQPYPGRTKRLILTTVLETREWVISLVAKCSR